MNACRAVVTALLLVASVPGCGSDDDATRAEPVQVVAAGDIARCDADRDEATAALVAAHPDATVLALGDNAYPAGSENDFGYCYAASWGAFRERTRPTPGNHEYDAFPDDARGYFDYFGDGAGPPRGYYSFDLGSWHVVALNSNCEAKGVAGCSPGSEQLEWLRADLERSRARCTLAFWHHPRFSSGGHHGSQPSVAPFWDVLFEHGADVVLSGHEHNYQRFAPQTPAGAAAADGIREFVVGTGGAELYAVGAPLATTEVQNGDTLGVLLLTLREDGYDWSFEPVAGATFRDSGSTECH